MNAQPRDVSAARQSAFSPERVERQDAPLHGRRVLVTRPEDQATEFVAHLRTLGAEPLVCPTIRINPPDDFAALDAAIQRLRFYDWVVFTSVNAVRFFMERLSARGGDLRSFAGVRCAAIGPATAGALERVGLAVDFVPAEYVAESIVDGIGDVRGLRMLLPRADIARSVLVKGLVARGAIVDDVTTYRTVPVEPRDVVSWLDHAPRPDIATFTSPSTVHNFVTLAGVTAAQQVLQGAVVACIGPITAQAALELGVRVDVVAAEHTMSGLITALVDYLALDAGRR